MEGEIESVTVIAWVQVAVLPHASVAFHVRVITDRFGQEASADESENVIAGAASQLSVAVTIPVTDGFVPCSQVTLILPGQDVIVGAVVSTTLIVCVQVAELPQRSVAVHVRVITLACGQTPSASSSL